MTQWNDRGANLSKTAQGLRGTFPNSQPVANGITWQVMAEANGNRLRFTRIRAHEGETC